MFSFDGKTSALATAAQALLDNSRINFDGADKTSSTCVIYRKDPRDSYFYITAMAGIREREPMFGPFVHDDQRRDPLGPADAYGFRFDKPGRRPNPLGFQKRENVRWHGAFEDKHWRIHLSGRAGNQRSVVRDFATTVLTPLRHMLTEASDGATPIFPELWYEERLGRNDLLKAVRGKSMLSSLSEVATDVRETLHNRMQAVTGNNTNELGLYLFTGENWSLAGVAGNHLPRVVEFRPGAASRIEGKNFNAFEWVWESTRPVLIDPRHEVGRTWKQRLEASGRIAEPMRRGDFRGLCMVPLLEHADYSRPIGILYFSSCGRAPIGPAHLFLLSRLAITTSGYLASHLPFPGCPWWPDVPIGRNARSVEWEGRNPYPREKRRERRILEIVRELMPQGTAVKVAPLSSGASGAAVLKCVVKGDRHYELPRVLKVCDEAKVIIEEARNYYRHVQNHKPGYASRIDVAKVNESDDQWGALVYLLVGGGERAKPWSVWAKGVEHKILEKALNLLHDQLDSWYIGASKSTSSAAQLLITEPFFGEETRARFHPYLEDAKNPDWREVRALLRTLRDLDLGTSRTCTVHGDLHTDNIFSILNKRETTEELVQVALIDWGSVHPDRHPLSDIAKLLGDLLYRIRWHQDSHRTERDWVFKQMADWQKRVGLAGGHEWKLAFIHQTTKMLFYSGDSPRRSFLSAPARLAAWNDVKELAAEVRNES